LVPELLLRQTAVLYINRYHEEKFAVPAMMNAIANYYSSINGEMFAIGGNFFGRCLHFFNIIEFLKTDLGIIVKIEDPLSGLSFYLKLEDLCKLCYNGSSQKIFMISLSKEGRPLEISYYLDPESKNGIFKYSC
jgi:hypothetical protein